MGWSSSSNPHLRLGTRKYGTNCNHTHHAGDIIAMGIIDERTDEGTYWIRIVSENNSGSVSLNNYFDVDIDEHKVSKLKNLQKWS